MRKYACLPLLLAVLLGSCKDRHAVTATNTVTEKATGITARQKELQTKYSAMLGVEPGRITNFALYQFIDEWYGTPYLYGGKTRNGVDCSGLTGNLYAQVFHKTISGSSASLFQACEPLEKSELKEGDLVFFRIDGNKISHVGIYLQNGKFVHATTKKGVMINDLKEEYYSKYFFKGGRIKDKQS